MLVSVKLQNNCILTYALLDKSSQGTFIDDELLSFLGTVFPETDINVKTFNGKEVCKTKVVEGLQVCGIEYYNTIYGFKWKKELKILIS